MPSKFYTPIATKAIIVEGESNSRLFWFWPLASLSLTLAAYGMFQKHPLVMLAMLLFFIVPICGLVWMELGHHRKVPQTLLSWHGGRLFLFEKGRHIRTLRSHEIQRIEVTPGRRSACLTIHTKNELFDQKLTSLGRGQKLQIQRIVRCLQAELAYKNAFDLPEDLKAIERDIRQVG